IKWRVSFYYFFFQAEDGIRYRNVTGVQTCALPISLPANRPGALHQVLSAFAWRFIDLSKIESRPLKTGLGEYFFIIDLVIDNNQQLIDYAISEIEQLGGTIQSLGTYPILSVKNN